MPHEALSQQRARAERARLPDKQAPEYLYLPRDAEGEGARGMSRYE